VIGLALAAALAVAPLATTAAGSEDGAVKPTEAAGPTVATAQTPATVQVQGAGDGGIALEVTARPVAGAGASPPYLVGVFDRSSPGAAPRLLGSFSFLPPRAGVAQTFVIPGPQVDPANGKALTLSIKLIPANPAADIKDAAVEILGARLIK